ncbi:aspartyl aminopeptidase [Oesophagostomum dentatum]|uniref:Aspartyl aminopeptidase n=1 Tax=Oesophagostomum dentatum TaxID=61180 RepID=A0A0B1T8X0_OESDE|nr:aspartyl aminopeptidase [Oesophagostomum dentatum]
MSYELASDGNYLRNGPAMMSPAQPEIRREAEEFVSFLNKAVTPFHAVQECRERLLQAGFEEVGESAHWNIKPNGKYFVTKNRSAIVAFAVGGNFIPGNGFSIVVGHTDSPCLRVKPISKLQSEKFNQVGVATYGGGIWRTWFDRDLCVAGEVVVKAGDTLARRLVNVDHPILYIPNLAIHLTKDRETFTCNNEKELRPILETLAAAGINEIKKDKDSNLGDVVKDPRDISSEHHQNFLDVIASSANATPEQIVDMDLYLYDANPARIGGIHDEFITGARLDNLVGTFTAIQGLIASLVDDRLLADDVNIRIAACFDNEEVGSQSAMGAQSSFMENVLRRLSGGGDPLSFEESIGRSLLISADQAHGVHPNYPCKYEENHRPAFHGGVIVKVNVNQRYATTSTTHAVIKQIAAEANVPLQKIVVRNDSPCGSTVGPILAARLGMRTVDVGCPQLAMHSIREMADTSSISQATRLYATFFNRMRFVLPSLM